MFFRRRPLLRSAVLGALRAQPSVPRQGGQMGQEPTTPSVSDQLAQLSTLHRQGSLNDAEFATAKSKLLGS